jgi:hypothetical protein
LRNLELHDVLDAAAEALSRATGAACRLHDAELLSNEQRRNVIVRARATRDGGPSQSVIVKATRSADYDPRSPAAFEDSGLIREWGATAYLATRAPARGHGARLLAGHVERGILVFEDLGANLGSLVGPLLEGSAEEAERALMSYAVALGRLHADTVGCADVHAEALKSILGAGPGSENPVPSSRGELEKLAAGIQAKIGGALPPDELAQVSQRVENPGAWLALVHGDPCPDNALVIVSRGVDHVRLIDFEFTQPAHALLDAIYWQFGFPTCWCAGRIASDVAARLDTAYRTEIGYAIPPARDESAYRRECAHIAVAWLSRFLAWRLDEALGDDTGWGVASIRSRVLWYLQAAIDMTGRADVLPGARSTAAMWLDDLQRRWPATAPLGLYPAFAARS